MKPFSKNIIFVDTEFSTLDPYKGEILSIGLVKMNGEELYLELEYKGEVSDWVKEHVLPLFRSQKVSREEAKKRIREFVGKKKPYPLAYVDAFDSVYLYKLFNEEENPFFWIPIDFASVLFGLGINPSSFNDKKEEFCKKNGIDICGYKQHNALDDAKLLRDIYLKLLGEKS